MKTVIYGGFGTVVVFAMIGSGLHIVDTAMRAGQPFQIALMYVVITDLPMLLAAVILIEKVTTAKTTTEVTTAKLPAKRTTPAKKTTAKKATTTPKVSAVNKTAQSMPKQQNSTINA